MAQFDWIQITQTLSPPLYRFFLARFSKNEAEDLVQEVLLRLLGKSEQFDDSKGSLEAYAWGIALNVQREWKRKRFPEVLKKEDVENDAAAPSILYEDGMALKKAVALLDEPQKTIMQMVLADLSIEQISTSLDIPDGTTKSHIYRAKENLRDRFKKWGIL